VYGASIMVRRFFLLYFPPLDWLASFGSWLRDLQLAEVERTTAAEESRRRLRMPL
jgi:hypothetical protein